MLYELALFIHIVAIALWFGGGVTTFTFMRAAHAADTADAIVPVVRRARVLGDRVFGPATGVALLSGLWLVYDGPWEFSDLWVILGLVGIGIAAVLGAGFHSRMGKRAVELCDQGDVAGLRELLPRWGRIAHLDLVVITLVIADMVFKPGA